jgi:DNA polymerase-3 subunit epsilon
VKHGALLDAQLLAQVYIELTGGRQIGLGLVADTLNVGSVSMPSTAVERIARSPRPHSAAPEEIARHRAFLAKIVNPLWDRFFAPTSEHGTA